jgi:putative ABC transport system substrate-binding protein
VSDPVGSGIVADLARPGGNATGLTDQGVDLVAKRLDLLREMVPNLTRVAVLGAPGDPVWKPAWNQLEGAARRLNLEPIPVLSDSPNEWPTLVAKVRSRVQAMYVAPQAIFVAHNRDVIQLAAREKLPAIYEAWGYVQNGGLISYGADYLSIFRGAARYVDKILRGTPAGDLPVEHTRDFRTSVNLKTAKALGLNVPQAVLLAADQVIR